MKPAILLSVFSILCFLQGLLSFCYLLILHFNGQSFPDIIYLAFIPMLQIIFGIWAWKGKDNAVFSKAIFLIRFPFLFYVLILFLSSSYPSSNFHFSLRPIFLLTTIIELVGIAFLFASLRSSWWKEAKIFIIPDRKWTFEEKNRFVFGVYIIALGFWLLINPNLFLQFVKMPVIENVKILYAIGLQVIILGLYNLVSSVHGIQPLIGAGIHGGFFAAIVFVLLVLTGFFHPMMLLIPLADIISIFLMLGRRILNTDAR